MVRARLATLTLAGGLLLTSSGCTSCSGFDIFRRWRAEATGPDCTCFDAGATHGAMVPTSVEIPTAGPTFVGPPPVMTSPPPQMTTPTGPPPRIVPIPAQPMPWSGH